MLDDTAAGWWYEQDGQQAGPVTAAAIGRLVAEGRLGPAHRVWRDGMSGWEPLGAVSELAEALRAARPATPVPPPLAPRPASFERPHAPPGPQAPPPGAASGPHGAGGFAPPAPASALEEISPGAVVILSVLTLAIYGAVKFHQTGRGYEALAGRASSFGRDFWLALGLFLASGLTLHTIFAGAALSVASLVFAVLALSEALALRDEAVRRAGIRPRLTDPGTHKVLFVLGAVLFPIGVGVVLLAIQVWKWFSDWNAVGAALAGAAPAPTYPAPGR